MSYQLPRLSNFKTLDTFVRSIYGALTKPSEPAPPPNLSYGPLTDWEWLLARNTITYAERLDRGVVVNTPYPRESATWRDCTKDYNQICQRLGITTAVAVLENHAKASVGCPSSLEHAFAMVPSRVGNGQSYWLLGFYVDYVSGEVEKISDRFIALAAERARAVAKAQDLARDISRLDSDIGRAQARLKELAR